MLARGIRSYHRPSRIEDAMSLAAQGAVPLAGGTRLLASSIDLPNVLDLSTLDLGGMQIEDEDLVLGAMATLQEVADSPIASAATGGLLPAACRVQSPSRMIRGMATLGGESIHGAHDSEVVAALLALNAVYVIAHPQETRESPALRFLRNPTEDLAGGGILRSILIPGAPDGAALERVAVLPSAPPLLAVAVTVAVVGDHCSRVRIALTGLQTRPARVLEAEACVERTSGDDQALASSVEQLVAHAPFRDDAQAPASYRKRVARAIALRALRRALESARNKIPAEARPPSPRTAGRAPSALPYFNSGRVELMVNGQRLRSDVEARTTLLELLRREGFLGAKEGCGTGACGACAVLLDGRPMNACLQLALRAQGRSVQTVEGLGAIGEALQRAFVETGAQQCGFCLSGMQIATRALLEGVPDPTEADVRDALAGCLCRCNGYAAPVEAVLRVARERLAPAPRAGGTKA
jgi:aerobic-type carbon monoxide dehydrogenase small subunit (CoxS/CutS family)/CO/xanthine dehydrogenase FAD-binding subunit